MLLCGAYKIKSHLAKVTIINTVLLETEHNLKPPKSAVRVLTTKEPDSGRQIESM